MTIGSCRAYFQLAEGITAGEPNTTEGIKQFVLNFGDEETTSIVNCQLSTVNSDDAWYDMSGRKLSGKPSVKGIYINNGHKIVIK